MRDTLSPSCLAIEKPPAVFAAGVTGIAVAGSGGGGGVAFAKASAPKVTAIGTGAGAGGGGGSTAAFARTSAIGGGFAKAVGGLGEFSNDLTTASGEDGSGGTTTVAARAAVRSASMTRRNGL